MDTGVPAINITEAEVLNGRKKGICGSTLKLIAIVAMLIDHTAAVVLERVLEVRGIYDLDYSDLQAVQDFFAQNAGFYFTYVAMRLIGRLGFPIFCYLLVEGFQRTRNVKKYAIRLFAFALISEIPFDLAFSGASFYMGYQNVFFTLLIGLLVLIGFKAIGEKIREQKWLPVLAVAGAIGLGCALTYAPRFGLISYLDMYLTSFGSPINLSMGDMNWIYAVTFSVIALIVYGIMCKRSSVQKASIRFADLVVLLAGMLLAQALQTDYAGFGVLTIAVIYGLRNQNIKCMLGGCITLTVMSLSEITSFFTLIPAALYNGKRGLNLKYVFYLFYPVHLAILYLICVLMKIA